MENETFFVHSNTVFFFLKQSVYFMIFFALILLLNYFQYFVGFELWYKYFIIFTNHQKL